MALIYSRPRIRLPKFLIYHSKDPKKRRKIKKVYTIIIVMIMMIMIINSIIKAIKPVFDNLCKEKAKSVATIICNRQTTQCIKGYGYSDFVIVHTDENKNIKMLEANMININVVISNIAEQIQTQIDAISREDIYISSGSFTGINLLSGRGTLIPIRISTVGNIKTDFKSEFINKGVNQTLHRLYLEIECEISILTPFNIIAEKINNQLIIAENVIVGNIPSNYYNLEGLETKDALELIE